MAPHHHHRRSRSSPHPSTADPHRTHRFGLPPRRCPLLASSSDLSRLPPGLGDFGHQPAQPLSLAFARLLAAMAK